MKPQIFGSVVFFIQKSDLENREQKQYSEKSFICDKEKETM